MSFRFKFSIAISILILLVTMGAAGWVWERNGAYGFNTFFRRGGTYWISIKADDSRLSPSMRLALSDPQPVAQPGPLVWQEPEKGFEVAELPVMVNGQEVDRILLNRIDPTLYRFVARNAPNGDKGIDEWEQTLPNAILIVNGSYYDLKGKPDTPIISNGIALGPTTYDARAGAFVAGDGFADIKDLSHQDWQAALTGAANAMVSYPLLIGADGQTHVTTNSRWLANRTFVGKDGAGRIIVGTTKEAFFPLGPLAEFLKRSPLDLKTALNFDGGPIACQSVRLSGFQRKLYARWEAQVYGDEVRLLRWPLSNATWAMPMVLTVERK
ncbi:phosphodiester glycosidase family protein [Rhizobium sp. RCC_161_2]|uniref:phosphodiester glycosidase family protein n=1 Tax=Rhizobium sp. RCC_161_2 TaxID=3239219 RepID=UPI003524D0C3